MSGAATAVIAFAFISARHAAAMFIGKATAIPLYVESPWAALPIPISHCRPIPNGRTRSMTGSESRPLLSTIRRDGPLERDDGSARDHLDSDAAACPRPTANVAISRDPIGGRARCCSVQA